MKADNKEALSDKQKAFCLEYMLDFNATQAAIRAGYSKKTARQQAQALLTKLDIQNYIKEISGKTENKKIMDINEIRERLTAVARGDVKEEVVVSENGRAKIITKRVSSKEQVRALELLGKANALFIDKVDASIKNDSQAELLKLYLEEAKNGRFVKNKKDED